MVMPKIVVVDDFLANPDEVRATALAQPFVKMHSAGVRTQATFLHLAPYREGFASLLRRDLANWDDNDANGRFQCCFATDAIPYHSDSQSYAGVLFLTPGAPIEAGLSFFRSRASGLRGRSADREQMLKTFGGDAEFNRQRWDEIDRIANLYNRLVLFDAHLAHGASAYFGDRLENARLFQNFFFNVV
jgi:hypothetical protein